MAFINNIYIHVTDENLDRPIETSSHSVEEGFDITDSVKIKPVALSLSGKIVDYGETKASQVISLLYDLQRKGALVEYRGRNVLWTMQIQAFSTSHPNSNKGGADFSMNLVQVRIAKNAYQDPTKSSEEGIKNAGTQQIEEGDESNAVFHVVKKGDTVWRLITKNYPNLKYFKDGKLLNLNTAEKCDWIMWCNTEAARFTSGKAKACFSKKGDFKTLQIGSELCVGYKQSTTTPKSV